MYIPHFVNFQENKKVWRMRRELIINKLHRSIQLILHLHTTHKNLRYDRKNPCHPDSDTDILSVLSANLACSTDILTGVFYTRTTL